MSKDEFDKFRPVKRGTSKPLEVVKSVLGREVGGIDKNLKCRKNMEAFAEEELVRKDNFDEMRCQMPGLSRSTFLMVFSPDGTKVASTHGNHNIYVTDIRTGKNIKTLVGHPRTPWCIAFHPSSNQIIASGCLGGQVRIWDLSGGSEVWSAGSSAVIASIAFHPNDRVLVIATYNEIYFWDWSQPEPFIHTSTKDVKEKVRYVAFDKLGHTLITGIANSPRTRWERVRAPVPVSRQAENQYRRRITSRVQQQPEESTRNIMDRERRISMCYRNLVREYEQLVERYLQLYRPPTMIDRGTDPMEPTPLSRNSGTQTPPAEPSTSSTNNSETYDNSNIQTTITVEQPSTSRPMNLSQDVDIESISPTEITRFIVTQRKLSNRKHKSETPPDLGDGEKRQRRDGAGPSTSSDASSSSKSRDKIDASCSTQNLDLSQPSTSSSTNSNNNSEVSSSNLNDSATPSTSNAAESTANQSSASSGTSASSTSRMCVICEGQSTDELLSRIRHVAEFDVRNRILPILRSVPANDRQALMKLFESNCRKRMRMYARKPPTSRPLFRQDHSSDGSSSDDDSSPNISIRANSSTASTSNADSNCQPSTSRGGRNFNTALEQLVKSLLTEIETNETDRASGASTSSTAQNDLEYLGETNRQLSDIIESLEQRISSQNLQLNTSNNNAEEATNSRPSFNNADTSRGMLDSTNGTFEYGSISREELQSRFTTDISTYLGFHDLAPSGSLYHSYPYTSERNQTGSDRNGNASELNNSNGSNSNSRNNITLERSASLDRGTSLERSSSLDSSAPGGNTNTRTTNSTIYSSPSSSSSSNQTSPRRFFSHRVSAFMPTRVNYTRSPTMLRRRICYGNGRSPRGGSPGTSRPESYAWMDQLINYSSRANSEDDPPSEEPLRESPVDLRVGGPHPVEPESPTSTAAGIESMYSNIVQDLESSLNDVRNIGENSRPGETSDMLVSFSERLENIMNQSNTILRNLHSSMDLLSNSANQGADPGGSGEPTVSMFDQNFYVRSASDMPYYHGSYTDHTYPRNPETASDGSIPLMTSLHLTISHIQRQARLLRQQVESIERIDRAMIEVGQLELLIRLLRHVERHLRNVLGDAPSSTPGVSSVRQMMAGTRISDSSPYDSQPEETERETQPTSEEPGPSSSSTSNNTSSVNENPEPDPEPAPTTSSSASSSLPRPPRPRGSSRKTYPPSRYFRLQRQSRRPSFVQYLSRRFLNRDRHNRPSHSTRQGSSRLIQELQNRMNCNILTPASLSLMTRRLERLLNEHMQPFTSGGMGGTTSSSGSNQPQSPGTPPPPLRVSIHMGEQILAIRLHSCCLRLNRILGSEANLRSDSSVTVTSDGYSRLNARNMLGIVADGMTRYISNLDSNTTVSAHFREQLYGVLALALLLCELLLLQIVDSIPPPSGMNLDSERESLTARIDQLCGQMLQNRFSGQSHQLTRSLRLMRLTMRHAYRALGQTYNARRNAIVPGYATMDRRQLIGSINRCLRNVHRRRLNDSSDTNRDSGENSSDSNTTTVSAQETPITATLSASRNYMRQLQTTLSDFFTRYNQDDEMGHNPSASNTTSNNPSNNINNNNSGNNMRETPASLQASAQQLQRELQQENDSSNNSDNDEPVWVYSNRGALFRNNNSNIVNENNNQMQNSRPWNVPSVQINDVPVSEPHEIPLFSQRLHTQRQRFAERVNVLRSLPSMFRPRFLHPLYDRANPFEVDLEDLPREQVYENDITTMTPNHRIQAWDISNWTVPDITDDKKNMVCRECKIHNDASVDVAQDGSILVTLLPSTGYLNVTNRLGVYSLRKESLGQCLYMASFDQNAVSVSLSPLSRHLIVGLASRRVSIVPNDRWVMARIFKIDDKLDPDVELLRELEQNRDSRINCIRWLPTSGQGLIYATNNGQLVILT